MTRGNIAEVEVVDEDVVFSVRGKVAADGVHVAAVIVNPIFQLVGGAGREFEDR